MKNARMFVGAAAIVVALGFAAAVKAQNLAEVQENVQIREERVWEAQRTRGENHVAWVKDYLATMSELDQYIRFVSWTGPVDWSISGQIDTENTDRLKALLHEFGWIKISVFGEAADMDAWLLAQHADHDPKFQKEVLELLTPLVKQGETAKKNYAYFYDRVSVGFGREGFDPKKAVQKFGTQGQCIGPNTWKPFSIEKPGGVDGRRLAMGLPPLAEYITIVSGRCP